MSSTNSDQLTAARAADSPGLTQQRTYPSLRAAWIPLAALCLAFFAEMVDNTLLSIALPTIGRDMGGDTSGLQWITGAYSLTFGGLLLTAGSIADRFGRKRVLQVGLALFGVLSMGVLLVSTIGELITLRAALGIAAAAMAPITNSLVFRLFDDEALRMRAITIMMVVGMSGFILGPVLGGTMLANLSWQWLLLVNAPVALLACIGVHFGVPADAQDGLTKNKLDLPGAALSILTIGLTCYAMTAGAQFGWLSPITLSVAVGAVIALVGFIVRERSAAEPMLDLRLFHGGTVRGAAIAQFGTSIAMTGVMFALVLHFQYAWGWSPMVAGLANLPMIVTMLLSSPITEWLVGKLGHRWACFIGAGLLTAGLGLMAWAVEENYLAIVLAMVVMMVGLRSVMTICAVALIGAMPANRTSMGAALNDTAQEVGTSVGTAVVGTLIAVLVTAVLPAGTWSPQLVSSFFAGERLVFTILAIAVGLISGIGALSLSNSHSTDEHPAEAADLEAVGSEMGVEADGSRVTASATEENAAR